MLEYLAYRAPLVVFWLTIIGLSYACVAFGVGLGRRFEPTRGAPEEKAFEAAQGAMFVLAALILGFSFSFAAARFDARRALIVQEANAIGTTYLRAAYLPTPLANRFRTVLRDYAGLRLAMYQQGPYAATNAAMERKSVATQGVLWSITISAAKSDLPNGQLGLLTQTLNNTIDLSTAQSAALRTHVPTAMLDLLLIVNLLSTTLLGMRFGQARPGQMVLALIFGFLFATVVTTIIDLDRPQEGLVRVNLMPLAAQLQNMQ